MIRELVDEGLFVLGVPDKKAPSGFKPYRWNWVTCASLALTEKGKALALTLYHADDP
jgi:hypothetical protein